MKQTLLVAVLLTIALPTLAANGTLPGESDPYEPVDVCGNIEGNQPVVPDGTVRSNNVCSPQTNGDGAPLCLSSGTCPCFGLLPGVQTNSCRAQFYPKGCEELTPFDPNSKEDIYPYPMPENRCAKWEPGYGPVVTPNVVTESMLIKTATELIAALTKAIMSFSL